MNSVSIREARQSMSLLLERVQSGEEIVILRRGQPVACLVPLIPAHAPFRSRASLRDELPPMRQSASTTVRQLRESERF